MIQNNSDHLYKKSVIAAINDLKNLDISEIDEKDRIEDLELFEDSLSIVIFFTSLEANLAKNFGKITEINIEEMLNADIKKIDDVAGLINLIKSASKPC